MREFRVHHAEFVAANVDVAGVSLDPIERNREWASRLKLPYPLLSDTERKTGEALGIIRRLGLAGWNIEFFRRATLLVDRAGVIRAVWERVTVRGHAQEVLAVAKALDAPAAPPG